MTPGDGPFCTSSFIVSFFIPHYLQALPLSRQRLRLCLPDLSLFTSRTHASGLDSSPNDLAPCKFTFMISIHVQEHPPEPTSSDVYIESINKTTYYVSTFGGFAIDPVVILKSKALIAKLDEAGKPIDKSHFYTAGCA